MDIIKIVDKNIETLKSIFIDNINDYFFTEKEIHSYFYHLFIDNECFSLTKGYNLLHTEYPSPFKCESINEHPYIKIADIRSNQQRAHIDCVILNPNFIKWVLENNKFSGLITGIGNKKFDLYIKDFYSEYVSFMNQYNESIITYAIEFKFLRHSFIGSKYPIIKLKQDVEKLRLLKTFSQQFLLNKTSFVEKVLSIVFIGERNKDIKEKIESEINTNDESILIISK